MSFNTLNFEQVNMLHIDSLEEFGGLPGGFPDTQERVESSLAQIEEVFGYDRYSTIEEKASALLYFFVKKIIAIEMVIKELLFLFVTFFFF